MAVVQVESEQIARWIGTNDPAVKAGLEFEVYQMGSNTIARK